MSEKTRAIVIRQADFSESSRVVTFLTREFGKLAMLAKGGRRAKNPFDSALDLLAESEIVFLKKQDALSLLTEASLVQRFRPVATDVSALYAGYYVAELLDGLVEENEPQPDLYDLATLTLQDLAIGEKRLRVLCRFELRLLNELGQCPLFDQCLSCGRPVNDADARFVHWVSQGGVLCTNCRVESYTSRELTTRTFRLLRRLADPTDELDDLKSISKSQVGELRSVINQLIAYSLERQPKSLRMLSF